MGKPDALSHRSDHGTGADDNSDVVLLSPKLFAVHALEGLQFTRPEQDILRDIQQGTKQLKEEPVARATQELQKSSTCSLRSVEWSEHDGLLYYHDCIYVPDTSDLRRRMFHSAMTPKWLGILVASNLGAHLPKLLVAKYVAVCRHVCFPLRLVPLH